MVIVLKKEEGGRKKGKYLQVFMFEGPEDPEVEEEWNRFYNKEHAPVIVKYVPGVIRAYRYVAIERGERAPKYITIYEMETPEALSRRTERLSSKSKEFEKAFHTDWYKKMQQHFRSLFGSSVYRQIYPEE